MKIDFDQIRSSRILPCTSAGGFRDPAAFLLNGKLYCFYSWVEPAPDGWTCFRLGLSITEDLVHWEGPLLLTEADRALNYSSPGCVLPLEDGSYLLCLQTYPTDRNLPGHIYGDQKCRIWFMRSRDLIHWSEPEPALVRGKSLEESGRMIDPFLTKDIHNPGRYLVFYKQKPENAREERTESGYPVEYVRYSSTEDLIHFREEGALPCGENVCVFPEGDHYRVYHSPENGIGCFLTRDFKTREERPLLTLGQQDWPWARRRLTAGFLLDGTGEPGLERYLMFFHGDESGGFPFNASIGVAWSRDLENWEYR